MSNQTLKTWQIFIIFLVVNIILSWLFQEYVMTREVYHSLLSDRLEAYRIDKQFELMNRFQVWGYLLSPIILWLKFTLVALLLQLPLMLKFIEIPFKQIFRVVMIASIAGMMMSATHFSQLLSLPVEEINKSVLKVMPCSLSGLVEISQYPESVITVLSTFNIFESCWIVLLFWGLVSISNDKLKKVDVAILVVGIWTFMLLLQYSLVSYFDKVFT